VGAEVACTEPWPEGVALCAPGRATLLGEYATQLLGRCSEKMERIV
jgi:hypothetical protein